MRVKPAGAYDTAAARLSLPADFDAIPHGEGPWARGL